MYSDKDFQTFLFRYKPEGEPHGISINSFCINQGVPSIIIKKYVNVFVNSKQRDLFVIGGSVDNKT